MEYLLAWRMAVAKDLLRRRLRYGLETFTTEGADQRSQSAFACGTWMGVFSTCSCIDLSARLTAGA